MKWRLNLSKEYHLHGCKNEKLYEVWCSMKARCNSKKSQYYSHYGGRGIEVCDEWQHEYINFKKWAYANGYKEGLWIDRIDVNGNYEPTNCRWATIEEQQNNKRDTVWITFKGETYSLHEWAKKININSSFFHWIIIFTHYFLLSIFIHHFFHV
jgi:hypothetical protein